ncbi:MAG TPA: acyltransferase [Flavitalea sp.]|nr:acyltransferase [Flavitalea sp.]
MQLDNNPARIKELDRVQNGNNFPRVSEPDGLQSGNNPTRIRELDGLRGIAILLVVSFHYINNQLIHVSNQPAKILSTITSFGWIGVDLFFVLSGFLIGNILIRNKGSKRYFPTFFIRRMLRIIPNYYLLVGVFLLIGIIPYFSGNYFLTGNRIFPDWTYIAMVHNFFMAFSENMGNDAMSVTWSIGIEEQFYLVFPFLVYYMRSRWLPYFLVFVMVLAFLARMQFEHWIPGYVLLHCRADALAIGALIAWFNQRKSFEEVVNRNKRILLLVPVFVVIGCALLFFIYQDLGSIRNSLFSIFFGFCLLWALTQKTSWYAQVLRNKVLVAVGTISYSLYLFHYLILGLSHHIAGNKEGIGIYGAGDILVSVIALIISFAVARGIYVFLESPMVQIGKRYKY